MNQQDKELWANWNEFRDADDFRAFQAWALNGSCIEQRMSLFTDVPKSWETLKPMAAKLKDFKHANYEILKEAGK